MTTLILSATYVNEEMAAEFGRLPPAFLPLGVRRLYQHQLDLLGEGAGPVHLSLPVGFEAPANDLEGLAARGVRLIHAPDHLSLGRSILYCLDEIGASGPLQLIYGDTLIPRALPLAPDSWVAGASGGDYGWARAVLDGTRIVAIEDAGPDGLQAGESDLVAGAFHFADAALLRRLIHHADMDFLAALGLYCAEREVTAERGAAWLDLGHLQTYYQSRAQHAASRAFNDLRIGEGAVRKSGEQGWKLRAEAAWLAALPLSLRPYSARLLGEGEAEGRYWYSTEYESLPTVAELYTFGHLGRRSWRAVLAACLDYLNAAAAERGPVNDVASDDGAAGALAILGADKLLSRLRGFGAASPLPLDRSLRIDGRAAPPILEVAEQMAEVIRAAPALSPTVMHGDFCFSNILYNARSQRVRVIDPRGAVTDGAPTVFGDIRYDMAKLTHSVVGRYDQIIAGQARLHRLDGEPLRLRLDLPRDPERLWLEDRLLGASVAGVRFDDPAVAAATVSLFLSMPPLHADRPDRQEMFLVRGLQLYMRFFGGQSPGVQA